MHARPPILQIVSISHGRIVQSTWTESTFSDAILCGVLNDMAGIAQLVEQMLRKH